MGFISSSVAAKNRVDLIRSDKRTGLILAYATAFKETGKRPYWFHDVYQFLIARPIGYYNLVLIFLATIHAKLKTSIEESCVLDQLLTEVDLIASRPEIVAATCDIARTAMDSSNNADLFSYIQTIAGVKADLSEFDRYDHKDIVEYIFREALLEQSTNSVIKRIRRLFMIDLTLGSDQCYFVFDSYWMWSIGHIANLIQALMLYKSRSVKCVNLSDSLSCLIHRSVPIDTRRIPIYLGGNGFLVSRMRCQRVCIGDQNHYHRAGAFKEESLQEVLDLLNLIDENKSDGGLVSYDILYHPRSQNYKRGLPNVRDTSSVVTNTVIALSQQKGLRVIWAGIEEFGADSKINLDTTQSLGLNGSCKIITTVKNSRLCIGAASGVTHLAASLNIPTLYTDYPWAVTSPLNEATAFLPKISFKDDYRQIQHWYEKTCSLSLEEWGDDCSLFDGYECLGKDEVAVQIEHFIEFYGTRGSLSRRSRHAFYVSNVKIYSLVFDSYQNCQKSRPDLELIHPADLCLWLRYLI